MTRLQRYTLLFCGLFTCWVAFFPVVRAFLPLEVSYNEGWNIYAATTVAQGQPLYPAHYAWITVNYPMLSFVLMAALHRLTHDYLFTARAVSILSLLVCGILVAYCVRALGGARRSALLAGLFCIAVFCAAQTPYVGVDDPQILANAAFLAGLAIYLHRRNSIAFLALSAFVFTIAFSIKHSPVEFILAVAIDLALTSLPLAAWFSACLGIFGALSFALHLRFGGQGFLLQLFTPRAYTAAHILDRIRDVFGPLLVPFALALFVACTIRKHPERRILLILMVTSLACGAYFAGGHGVYINCFFGAVFTLCLLLGLFWDSSGPAIPAWVRDAAPCVLFLWLLIPMALNGQFNPVAALHAARAESRNQMHEVDLITSRPGPALCESLLVCYQAKKAVIFDPFNATRLIATGKLDQSTLLQRIRQHEFSSIQVETTLAQAEQYERLPHDVVLAIQQSYQPLNAGLASGAIYVPRTNTENRPH